MAQHAKKRPFRQSTHRSRVPDSVSKNPGNLALEPLKGQSVTVGWPDESAGFPGPPIYLSVGVEEKGNQGTDHVAYFYLGVQPCGERGHEPVDGLRLPSRKKDPLLLVELFDVDLRGSALFTTRSH